MMIYFTPGGSTFSTDSTDGMFTPTPNGPRVEVTNMYVARRIQGTIAHRNTRFQNLCVHHCRCKLHTRIQTRAQLHLPQMDRKQRNCDRNTAGTFSAMCRLLFLDQFLKDSLLVINRNSHNYGSSHHEETKINASSLATYYLHNSTSLPPLTQLPLRCVSHDGTARNLQYKNSDTAPIDALDSRAIDRNRHLSYVRRPG